MVVYDPETVVDRVKGWVVAIPEELGVRKEVAVKDVDLEYVPEGVPDNVEGGVVAIPDGLGVRKEVVVYDPETVVDRVKGWVVAIPDLVIDIVPDSVKAAVVGIADAETVTAERVKAAVVGIADGLGVL